MATVSTVLGRHSDARAACRSAIRTLIELTGRE